MPRKRTTPQHDPIHPGEVLKHDFMDPLGITAYRVAKDIGVSAQHVGRIVAGTRGVGAELALRLARYFGTSAELWVNLQARYDLEAARDAAGDSIREQVTPRDSAAA